MVKCFYDGCLNFADYIDTTDCYVCSACMDNDIDNGYTDQEIDEYEKLNWKKFPINGFSE